MKPGNRIIIVDALRGFALLLIVLIHFVEHFDFFKAPEFSFLFSPETDGKVMEWIFILISGKAYSIFALLFGLSFFIQMDRKASEGMDFRLRFLWRITILLIIGFIHSLIYRGDILHIYALLALPLIALYKVPTKGLIVIAVLLILQIPTIDQLVKSFNNPDFQLSHSLPGYFEEGNEIYAYGSFIEVLKYNFWKGRITVWSWTINNGRYLQLLALFIIGLVLGRKRIFEKIDMHKKGLTILLSVSIACFFIILFIYNSANNGSYSDLQKHLFSNLLISYGNLMITTALVCLITLLHLAFRKALFFELLAAVGKMSLSNYVFQAVFGVILFYGFGFSLYKYLGSTWSLILGFVVFFTQAFISLKWKIWFYFGPLEWLWRALTYIDFSLPFRKKSIE